MFRFYFYYNNTLNTLLGQFQHSLVLLGSLLILGTSGQIHRMSTDCAKFCDSKRPSDHNQEFEAFCGVNNTAQTAVNKCPGICKANSCDDSMCPDGMFAKCPEINSQDYPRNFKERYDEHEPKNNLNVTALVGIICGVLLLVIIIILTTIFVYCAFLKRKRVEDRNRFLLQAPRTYADGRTPESIQQSLRAPEMPSSPPPPTSGNVTLSSNYMSAEGIIKKISPTSPPPPPAQQQQFDFSVQPT